MLLSNADASRLPIVHPRFDANIIETSQVHVTGFEIFTWAESLISRAVPKVTTLSGHPY